MRVSVLLQASINKKVPHILKSIDSKEIFLAIIQKQNFCRTSTDFFTIKYYYNEHFDRKVIFETNNEEQF